MNKYMTILVLSLVLIDCVRATETPDTKADPEQIVTFVYVPPKVENVYVWVIADKVGPLINRSCKAKDESYSKSLPAEVKHSKDEKCPEYVAKFLANYVSLFHIDVLPLTIFNGWQWEYAYSLAEYDGKAFELSERGGSWETCYEAVFVRTLGESFSKWSTFDGVQVSDSKSEIIVQTFTDMRARSGYPKQRELK